ncbi:hypothetical protein BJX96DRAFT_177603 [Aspergillus floccosus]
MSLHFLTLTAMGSTELRDVAESKRAKNMRLQNVIKNQLLALSEPSDDFTVLDGQIVEIRESSPSAKGQPRDLFKPGHDIYSLGVVLLEIALWWTISSIFKEEVDKRGSSGKLLEPERIRKALLDRAREDIPREMGESYARAVERCLLGDFGIHGDDQKQTKVSVAFRELVIDAVAAGSNL